MTAADLLARLAQRPPKPADIEYRPGWEDDCFEHTDKLCARAEFDRDLLLDAWDYYEAMQRRCEAHMAWVFTSAEIVSKLELTAAEGMYQLDLRETEAARDALRTIVATLRETP